MRQLIVFSIPIILGNLLQSAYTTVDMLIVGNLIGADGLSATGIAGVLQGMLLMIAMGLGAGSQILLSQQVGARDDDRLSRTIGTTLTISLICTVLMMAVGLSLTRFLLQLLNTPAEVYNQTRNYYVICCCGLIFIDGYNAVCALLRGLGESKLPTIFIAIASVINIILDYVFIRFCGMNVEGAALATVIAQGIAFLIAMIYLFRKREAFGFDFKLHSFIPDGKVAKAILKLSAPLIIFGLVMSLSGIFINSNINSYGVTASAVDSVGNRLNMIMNTLSMGLYTGGATILAQNFGARKMDRVRRIYWLVIGFSLMIWVVVGFFMLLFPTQIFRIFTSDADVLAIAPNYMKLLLLSFFGMSVASGAFTLFEGVGNTNLEMWTSIAESLVVKIALGAVLSRWLGMYGYWAGMSISTLTTPLVGMIYYFSGLWRKRKLSLE